MFWRIANAWLWSNIPIAVPTTKVIVSPIPNVTRSGCAVIVFMILSFNNIDAVTTMIYIKIYNTVDIAILFTDEKSEGSNIKRQRGFHSSSRSSRKWIGSYQAEVLVAVVEALTDVPGITMSRICSTDGGMTVIGKESKVGEAELEGDGKCNCSSALIQLPLYGNSLL